jgi:hypothetical protein
MRRTRFCSNPVSATRTPEAIPFYEYLTNLTPLLAYSVAARANRFLCFVTNTCSLTTHTKVRFQCRNLNLIDPHAGQAQRILILTPVWSRVSCCLFLTREINKVNHVVNMSLDESIFPLCTTIMYPLQETQRLCSNSCSTSSLLRFLWQFSNGRSIGLLV